MYNVIEYLDEKGIDYRSSGKNIGQGWIGVPCPFCEDTSNHMGINLESANFNCWRCGESGSFSKFVAVTEQKSFKEARRISDNYKNYYKFPEETKSKFQIDSEIRLPPYANKSFHKKHLDYLKRRRYNPFKTIERYDLYCCTNLGDYPWRVLIPVYLGGKIVTFTTADVNPNSKMKYKHCPNNQSVIPIKSTLYNVDNVEEQAVIVEGVLDSWRIGKGSVALFGTKYTPEQINMIRNLNLKKVFVMLDEDATTISERLCNELSAFVPHVEQIQLESGDPDNLSKEEIIKLKRNLGLRRK